MAFEQMLSMPYATQLLALLGADVVKVEPLRGEGGRQGQPSITVDGDVLGATFMRGNLSKRSIAIDLKKSEGHDLALRLVRNFDVVTENMRPGVLDSLGLGYEQLRAVKADVILVSLTGFGNYGDSPYRSWPAYAPVVDATAGWYEMEREPDAPPPIGSLGALGDVAGGLFAVIGALAAFVGRERTGQGDHVDVAMADASLALNDAAPLMWSMGKSSQGGGTGIIAGFRADDGYFAVTVIRPFMFERFATVIGRPEWTEHPLLASRAGWADHVDDIIRPVVEEWAKGKTKLEAARLLAAAGVAAAPSNDAADIVTDPHYRRRGMLIDTGKIGHEGRPLLVAGVPMQFKRGGYPSVRKWPEAGEHSIALLEAELGLSADEVADLVKHEVVADGRSRR